MLFPIIKVKNKCFEEAQIVGTNSHDQLYIDKETGGIHYIDLQCMGSTKKYNCESTYNFVRTETNEYSSELVVEFVTIEEAIELATKNLKEQTETKLKLDDMIKKYIAEMENSKKLLKDAIPDTSGMLY